VGGGGDSLAESDWKAKHAAALKTTAQSAQERTLFLDLRQNRIAFTKHTSENWRSRHIVSMQTSLKTISGRADDPIEKVRN
jgi:hypothetical protein